MNAPVTEQEVNYPLLQVDPILEMGLKELIRGVVSHKSVHVKKERTEDFVVALYETIRRVAMFDELDLDRYNKMVSQIMDGLAKVYFDGMDFDTLTLDMVNEYQDDLTTVVAECMTVAEDFMHQHNLIESN
jgi:hypothetical protein